MYHFLNCHNKWLTNEAIVHTFKLLCTKCFPMGLIDQSDDRKPLFKAFTNRQKKAGIPLAKVSDLVLKIKFSSSEEWLMIECKSSMGLLKAESKAARAFWEFCTTLDGELRALIMIPAKGKIGFDIITCDKTVCEWTYDSDDEVVYNSFFNPPDGSLTATTSLDKLTLEEMRKPVASLNPAKARRNGKTSEDG